MTTIEYSATNPPPYEDIDAWVRYYHKIWGCNAFPAPSQDKGKDDKDKKFGFVLWHDYQREPISDEQQEEWIRNGEYTWRQGIGIIPGKVWRGGPMKGKYLMLIDGDNELGNDIICEMFGCNNLDEVAALGVVVEQHEEDAPNKAHYYFYSDIPFYNLPGIKTRRPEHKADYESLIKANKFPSLEFKAQNGCHFGTPGLHVGGYRYRHTHGSPPVPTLCLTESEVADKILKLESILNRYGDSYMEHKGGSDGKANTTPVPDMWKPEYRVTAGNNRHLDVRKIGASELIKSKMANKEQSLSVALQWNQEHCEPPLEVDDVKAGFYKYSVSFAEDKLWEREQAKKEQEAEKAQETVKKEAETAAAATAAIREPPSSPLLKGYNNDFFEYLIDVTSKTVKQENTLLRQIHYTFLSGWADRLANNLNLRAPSSEGKSYPILQARDVSGEDEQHIITINRITPTALIYQSGGYLVDKNGKPIGKELKQLNKEIGKARNSKRYSDLEDLKEQRDDLLDGSAYVLELSNKCFLLLEPPKEGLWDLLKAILSHDKYETRHMMTDRSTKGMETRTVILKGFPAFMFCSAKDESKWEVWDEVQTRFMSTSPNMTQQKYYEGNKLIGQKFGLPNYAKHKKLTSPEELRVARDCYNFLKYQIKAYNTNPDSSPVWIPYQDQITEVLPRTRGSDNRVTARLFQMLSIITLCRAHLRDKITFPNGETCVISNLEDLAEALHVTQNVSGLPPHKLKFYKDVIWPLHKQRQREIKNTSKKLLSATATTDDGRVWITSREITDYYNEHFGSKAGGKTYNIGNIDKTYLEELHNHNYLEKIQLPEMHKTAYFYYPLVEVDEDEDKPLNSLNLTRFNNILHYMRLSAPENYKEVPENWLELQFKSDFNCGIDTEDITIGDRQGSAITIKDWIARYESPKLKLSHFIKTKPSGFNDVKNVNIARTEPSNGKAVVKIVKESVSINEILLNRPGFNRFNDNGKGEGGHDSGGGGISVPSQTKAIAESQTTVQDVVSSGDNIAKTTATSARYIPSQPAQQRQMLLVEAYELERQEQAKINNEDKTLRLLAEQRNKIPPELRELYESSVSVDPEWINEHEQEGGIRRITAMSFVDWEGKERVFHINDYEHLGGSLFERTRTMLNDIFTYWFDNYRMSFGFNSLGEGSDREVIFENAQHYNTTIQPVEEQVIGSGKNKRTYYRFKERELRHTHIDWHRIFKNKAVWTYVFEQKYRCFGLDVISRALFDVGKYGGASHWTEKINELPTEEQKMYVLQDSRLLSLLTTAETGNLFGAMQYIADLLELPLPKVCHSQVSQYWTTIYEKMGHKAPLLVEKTNPETGETETIAEHYYYRTKIVIAKRGKNKGIPKVKVISYAGGRVLEPTPDFYRDVIGLDQESQYPTVSIALNAGFENMCTCPTGECENDPSCKIKNTGDPEIDNTGYYICKHFVGDTAYKQRLVVFREARIRAKENSERVKDLALKIIINAAYGVWGFKKWPFADTRLASTITCLARKKHKEMEDLAKALPYNFEVVGGDTDSLFIKFPKDSGGALKVKAFCDEFKARYGITVKPSKKQWSKMLITKKKHYIYWPLGDEDNPIIKGMEGAKNNMPKLTNIVFDQFINNIGADRDFIPDLRRAWLEEYPYCKKHRPDLLQIEVRVGKDPEKYVGDKLIKRLAIHQHKDKDDTISYYDIGKENEKKYGLDAYLNPEYINDEIYKQKFFISPFKAALEQLGYDVMEVFD